MNNKLLSVLAVAVGLLVVAGPMFAHHSLAMYDTEHAITLEGTVTDFAFVNPHVQIHFAVKDDKGNVENWAAGSAPPQRMYRAGWNRNTLKIGDQITVTGYPAKDGRKVMSVRKLTGPSGQVLTQGAD